MPRTFKTTIGRLLVDWSIIDRLSMVANLFKLVGLNIIKTPDVTGELEVGVETTRGLDSG